MPTKQLKEITVLCEQGDSAKLSTWSNVPYFLTTTLEKRGIKVNRVNLHPGTCRLHKLFYKLWNVFSKGIFRNKYYTYRRTGIYFYLTERKIRHAIRQYPDSNAFLFTTYNVSSKPFIDKPVMLFGDWTADYEARFFKGLKPSELPYHEKKFIKRQNRNIETADCVVCLFPGMAKDMQTVYKNRNIHYIGNVVNALYEPSDTIIDAKEQGTDILFVGKKHYLKGALELLEAFELVKTKIPNARLHIIGMKSSRFKSLPEGATCYGYLSKDNPDQCRQYYKLLNKCRLFINTTPKWGAFSASVEAMYYYTPVIITPYGEFTNTFGSTIDFGSFHNPDDGSERLADKICQSLTDSQFRQKAIKAHDAVAEMSWDNFATRLTNLLQNTLQRDEK